MTITNSTITTLLSNDLTVRGLLEVDNGAKFDDNGKYVYVNGNILNSGILAGQLTGGGVRLNGTTAQTIGGNGKGIFNNLILDKSNTTGVTLTADQSLTGNLRLANTNGNLNIGSNKLSLSEVSNIYTNVTSTAQVYDNSHMIISSGLQSDGGVSKAFNDMNKSFIYPLGFGTAYHPASILFNNSPSQWGSVTIRSVSVVHPLVQGTNQAIKCYWKTTSDGFTGGIPAGITQKYFYQPADAPVASDEANYIPAAYISPVWKTDFGTSAVLDNLTPREIDFTNVNYLDGEYTAGLAAAFNGLKVYYSRDLAPNITTTGADWNDKNTWSLTSHSDASGLSANLTNDQGHAVFIIGDGTSSHKVNISQNIIKSGNLVINTNSTLDIGTTTGHSFGSLPDSKIAGKGTLRIASTGYFPSADWGDFLGQTGGTVDYYTTSATSLNMPTQYTLPSGATMNINSYYNLKSSPYSGSNIIFPNQSLTVYGDFTIGSTSGGINCVTQLNPGASSKTLDLKGKLNINQYGILRYMNAAAQNVVAEGDIAIANGGTFDVTTSGTASLNNTLTVSGNLTNNGTFDMNPATNRYCNLTFTGSNNKVVDGTTASRTRFYTINVNKGSSRDTIIDVKVNSTNFALNGPTPALTLTNGTFRLTTPVDITLTTGTFNIPITCCLSANGGTMRMATAAAGNDLTLDGRVEVLNGAIYVGDSAKVQNNDIEYSSGGTPEIRVSGGRLFVNGQVRRVTTINTGSLNYYQSGGSVFVAGQNANNARAMFEILNSGSKFQMSGGTLILANNFNDANYQDLYLTPESSSVTGGTIQFGSLNTTPAVSQFNIVASSPLWNVTVDGYNTPVVNLQVYSLVVNNDLLINGNSVFNANGLDVSIGHNLTNNNTGGTPAGISSGGYQPGSLTQNTTFNGTSSQVISGAGSNLTNFANLIVATSGTLSLNANSAVQVNGNLTLKSGILSDGANAINVLGNIENDAIHQSSDINGGIRLISNSGRQVISGNGSGTFGNVELVNNNGINMIDNSVINGQLKFTSGSLYIDDYLLTLGASSSVIGYNSNRMILLNGALSDEGVKKIFSAGTNSFTYPIGISGKFTPVTYDVNSASTTGFITVKPVNSAHPAETDAIGDELAYYWSVKASGLSGAKFNHKYQYVSNDVKGTESSYVGGRYSYYKWYSPVGTVDVSGHALNIGASDSIAGEYTVGDPLNFQSKPVLYSRNERSTNKWTVDDTWSTEGPAGASCNCHPDGNPVIIAEGHTIVLDANSAKAFSVDIKGTLDAGTTTFHNLGHVLSSGTGTLRLTPTTAGMYVFPGGEFDDFMEKTGTTVEFYGSTNGTLPLKPGNYYKPYQNVHFTNTAISYMSAENLRALGNLTIENGCKLNNTLYNKDLSLLGNWTDNNTSTGGFNAGTGTVSADGNAAQTFTMASGVTEYFYNYTMNNSSTGVTLSNGNITVNNQLNLNSGNMTTNITNTGSNQNFTVNNSSTTAVTGGSSASFVNGFLRKKISNGSYFGFPVGDATTRQRYGAVSVLSTSTSGDQIWAARFVDKNPTTDSYDINQVVDPLAKPVSDNEYWNVVGPTGGSANIRLRWDQYSGAGTDASARQKFMVAEWASPVSGAWNASGKLVNDGGQTSGTVETTTPVGLDNHIFTLGTSSLPTARISSTSPSPLTICNDGTLASLVISFTDVSNSPFGFEYSINGVEQPAVTNVSSPYTLTFSGTTLGALANMTSPATYTVKLIDVWDKTNTHGYIRTPVSAVITVNPVPTNTITGRTSAGTGESDTYSTPADGASYSWNLDGTNMGTSTSFSTTWGSAGTHTVALTKTNSYGCSVTNSISVVVTTTPSPVISGNNYVCSGSSQTYSTTNFSGHTYTWTVPGGTISSGSGTSSITVSWPNSAGTGTVNLKECNGSNCKDATSMSVSIGQSPSDRTIGPLTQNVCEGNKAEITVTNSESFVTYQIQAAGINSGSAVSGNGSSIVLNTDVLKPGDAPSYTVHAYTEAPYNCAIDLTGTANVTINPLPVAAGLISGSDAVCQGQSGIIYTLPAVNYATAYNWVLPSGITITSGATTNSITVNIAGTASPGTLILQVNGTNSCGSGSASNYSVTISLTPVTGPVYREPNN
ncbi:MAG: hypothetical protein Q8903_05685 [Bacteroidota bacterium]|nr:hypothetical protein [Bacteroidota bacterium]